MVAEIEVPVTAPSQDHISPVGFVELDFNTEASAGPKLMKFAKSSLTTQGGGGGGWSKLAGIGLHPAVQPCN